MTDKIIPDETFPIVGWAGPSDAMIRKDIMDGMARCGFNVSVSSVKGDVTAVEQALDIAAESGVRLILTHPAWHVGDDYQLTEARKTEISGLVQHVRHHPGLYAYSLRDEPLFDRLDTLAEVKHFITGMDDTHPCYINHFPPYAGGFGAVTQEVFWNRYIEKVKPALLSYDHYALIIGTDDDMQRYGALPNVFPEEKLIVKPDFFEYLDFIRTLSLSTSIPFWVFTLSIRHGLYPEPTEGHMRFQLMNALAYGAKGLQYFTYAHGEAMVRADGSTTPTWKLAKRINGDIRVLAGRMKDFRSIGVFRTGPVWSGTRQYLNDETDSLSFAYWRETIQWSVKPTALACVGDPVTLGFFLDQQDQLFVMVVNGNPCSYAAITLKLNTEGQNLLVVDPATRTVHALWPANPQNQKVLLAPGEGRLFQVGGAGEKSNF